MVAAGLGLSLLALTGCEFDSYMDPSVTGRWENTPTTVPILERLSSIEGPVGPAAVETTGVRPEDLIPEVETYRLGPGDSLEVRIQDLFRPDTDEAFPRPVDSRGYIDIPRIGRLFVDGLTEEDVQALVAQTLIDKGLFTREPIVSVAVTVPRRSTYNILGGVNSPGLYPIPRPDYRLLEALTSAGRFSENVQSVYVIRYIPLTEKVLRGAGPRAPQPAPAAPANPVAPAKPPENVIDLIDELSKPKEVKPTGPVGNPGVLPGAVAGGGGGASRQPANPPAKEPPIDLPGEERRPAPVPVDPNAKPAAPASTPMPAESPATPAADAPAPAAAPVEPDEKFWVFRDGKWMQVTRIRSSRPSSTPMAGGPRPAPAPGVPAGDPTPVPGMPPPPGGGPVVAVPAPQPGKDPFQPPTVPGAEKLVTQRVIEVPMAPLLAGSAQFNIVIRPGDVIRVPSAPEGIVYVMGEVNRPGTYSLPANGRLTIERAIASAGGLSNIAIPERMDLTRMVAPDRQATVRLDYRAISERTMPDIFLKPDDVINVGTNFWAFPLAVVRQGFRFSYGFGFILDRNFDDGVFGPRRISR